MSPQYHIFVNHKLFKTSMLQKLWDSAKLETFCRKLFCNRLFNCTIFSVGKYQHFYLKFIKLLISFWSFNFVFFHKIFTLIIKSFCTNITHFTHIIANIFVKKKKFARSRPKTFYRLGDFFTWNCILFVRNINFLQNLDVNSQVVKLQFFWFQLFVLR